jgi:hypothetical protein
VRRIFPGKAARPGRRGTTVATMADAMMNERRVEVIDFLVANRRAFQSNIIQRDEQYACQ